MENAQEFRISSESYVLLFLATLSYFLFTFSWFALPAYLIPIVTDLGLTGMEAGIVTGAIQLSYIPLSMLSGLFIDRLGSRKAIFGGIVLIGIAHASRGVSTGFITILIPTLFIGVGGTAITFGLPKLVSELFPPNQSGTMSSVYLIGATLGSAAVFAVARPVLGPLTGGWRQFFMFTGIFLVFYGLIWGLVSWYLWEGIDLFPEQFNDQVFSIRSLQADFSSVVTHRGLLLIVVIATMELLVNHGLRAWLPTILESRGMATGAAASVTSLFILFRIVGVLTIPPLSDRLSARRPTVIGCGLLILTGLSGVLISSSNAIATLILLGFVTVGLGGIAPLMRAIPIEMEGIGPRLTAAANGLIFTFGQVGGFLGPYSIGTLNDVTGSFVPGLGVLVGGSIVIILAGYFMVEPASN